MPRKGNSSIACQFKYPQKSDLRVSIRFGHEDQVLKTGNPFRILLRSSLDSGTRLGNSMCDQTEDSHSLIHSTPGTYHPSPIKRKTGDRIISSSFSKLHHLLLLSENEPHAGRSHQQAVLNVAQADIHPRQYLSKHYFFPGEQA